MLPNTVLRKHIFTKFGLLTLFQLTLVLNEIGGCVSNHDATHGLEFAFPLIYLRLESWFRDNSIVDRDRGAGVRYDLPGWVKGDVDLPEILAPSERSDHKYYRA